MLNKVLVFITLSVITLSAAGGFQKWQGPTLNLSNNDVEVFQDDFARCYVIRDVHIQFSRSDSMGLAMSCVKR